jgi:hypothetical protein
MQSVNVKMILKQIMKGIHLDNYIALQLYNLIT